MPTIFNKEYQIGDKVITTGAAQYEISTAVKVPIGTIRVISSIRHRYKNSTNEYKQYKDCFECYPDGDNITNLYLSYDLIHY
jgi:hypothetical protein